MRHPSVKEAEASLWPFYLLSPDTTAAFTLGHAHQMPQLQQQKQLAMALTASAACHSQHTWGWQAHGLLSSEEAGTWEAMPQALGQPLTLHGASVLNKPVSHIDFARQSCSSAHTAGPGTPCVFNLTLPVSCVE